MIENRYTCSIVLHVTIISMLLNQLYIYIYILYRYVYAICYIILLPYLLIQS